MPNSIWNSLISKLPNPHFLQTYEWGQVKAKYGWESLYVVWDADGKWKVENGEQRKEKSRKWKVESREQMKTKNGAWKMKCGLHM